MKITLEEYKKKVEECLKNLNNQQSHIKKLMTTYDKDIQEAFKNNWQPMSIALPMSMGL